MPTQNELHRLAGAINTLRPEWPVPSLLTFLTRHHANRPLRDLGVALMWVACDPDSKTPARVNEAGPWWQATQAGEPTPLPPRNLTCEDHGPHTGIDCPRCVAAAVPMPERVRELIGRQA